MQEPDRIQRLQAIFSSLGGDPNFTERQQAARGDVPDERAVDDRLRRLIGELRVSSGFRTNLSDEALVTLVRGYYDGETDGAIAEALGASPDQVARARVNLHLFRPADTAASFDVGRLRELLDENVPVETAAAELDASPTTVRRYAHVLRVQEAARRSGYRYPGEFEELLGVADDARLASTHLLDRRTMDEVVD